MCSSVLQCIAVYCSELQCVAVWCSMLRCAPIFDTFQQKNDNAKSSDVIYLNESCHLYECVMSHVNELCHTYE